MRVPLAWLKEYCDPGLSAEPVGVRLSLSGTELERILRVGMPSGDGNAGFFRIGKVVSAEQHPDADRLRVCKVQLAGSDMRTIVCGAPNVAAGETVLVALARRRLADGTKLGRAKLRGVESDGMILSETEVQLGPDSGGIMVLPDSLEVGEEAGRYVTLGDDVLEFEVNPNRPDCMSVYGIARELHAVTEAPLAPDPAGEDAPAEGEGRDYAVAVGDGRPTRSFARASACACSRTSGRPLAALAEGASGRRRPAADQQRRRHHQLRDAAARPADARLRPGPARRPRAPRAQRHVRASGSRPSTARSACFDEDAVLVCDASGASGIGGIMGGGDQRGLRRDHAGGDGGRDLERPQHPRDLDEAGPSHRGERALREAAPSRSLPWRPSGSPRD